MIELNNPDISYFVEFSMMDGHMSQQSRNRGKLSIELSSRDYDILSKFKDMFKNSHLTHRIRNTNFKDDYESVIFSIYNKEIRDELINIGFKYGEKNFFIPNNIVTRDFWRGIIDADGSLGFMKSGRPFVSLVISDELMKDEYLLLIKMITGKDKNVNRNKRDNVYNIMITDEDAQELVKLLYYNECLAIDRKLNMAHEILSWKRNTPKRNYTVKKWTDVEDEFILSNSLEVSIKQLNRTEKSIKTRLWRLNKAK